MAVNDIVWTEVEQVSTEQYRYETRHQEDIGIPLLAFVDDGIYLNSRHRDRQEILDVTFRLYSLLGFERN